MQRLPLLMLLLLPLLQLPRALAAQAPAISGIAYKQKLGNVLPRQLLFQESTGRTVRLESLGAGKPLVLVLGYFHCPRLCSVVRASLLEAISASGLSAGRDYSLAALSIDSTETSTDAARAKAEDLSRFPLPGAEENWHFLVGEPAAVHALSDAVGFRARPDPQRDTFIHPAGIVFLTPDARVSSYLLGAGYRPEDVRLAIARASIGGISATPSPVLLLCFDYDPATGRYTPAIMKILRLAAAITVVALAGLILHARLREKRA